MEFFDKVTTDDLKGQGIPTFNNCEHYLVKPHPGTEQTVVIELEGGKYLTVNVNPKSDNVDVQLHGSHTYLKLDGDDSTIHSFSKLK